MFVIKSEDIVTATRPENKQGFIVAINKRKLDLARQIVKQMPEVFLRIDTKAKSNFIPVVVKHGENYWLTSTKFWSLLKVKY